MKVWLAFYAFALCLFPPLGFHGRIFFAAEWALLPLFILFASRVFRREAGAPPKELIYVWLALIIAFIAGIGRGELAQEITIYRMLTLKSDAFQISRDGIRLVRWLVIFSTPWIAFESFKGHKNRREYFSWFCFAVRWACVLSALCGFLEQLGFLNLARLGYHGVTNDWIGRLYGTSPSPLEASLLYGFVILETLFEYRQRRHLEFGPLFSLGVLSIALLWTHGGTAILSLLLVLSCFFWSSDPSVKQGLKRLLILGTISFITVIMLYFSWDPVHVKIFNFLVRFETWQKWFALLPQHPLILFTGFGFSDVTADSSFFTLLIKGGLILCVASFLWLRKLVTFQHLSPEKKILLPLFIFWVLSWLSLDSIGFWGIGRVMWLLFGVVL